MSLKYFIILLICYCNAKNTMIYLIHKLNKLTEAKGVNEMNKELLLESLKGYITTIDETMKVDLIRFIEDEGLEVTDELLIYLWDGIKNIEGIKRAGHTIKLLKEIKIEITKSFIVYR